MVDGSVRMNITVPAALKKRMDGVKERVNWSAIASRAFEAEIDRIHEQREIEGMSEIVKRLRETKRAEEAKKDEVYAEGFEAGKAWAAENATATELGNMYENYQTKLRGQLDEDTSLNGVSWYDDNSPTYLILELAGGTETSDWSDFHDRLGFDNRTLCAEMPELKENIRYCIAFVEGAVAVWEEVKDQI